MTTPVKRERSSSRLRNATTGLPSEGDTKISYTSSYGRTEPFTKPHTVTFLLGTVALVVYALYTGDHGEAYNADQGTHIKRGLSAAIVVGLVFCTEHLRDTLFMRPHPAIWRLVNGIGLFYTMALAFALFQPLSELRDMMTALDPVHAKGRYGAALEQTYAADCSFTMMNMWDAMDRFVIAHFVGWIAKAFMFRHVGIAMTTSFLFELLEYTFEYLQPNFAECWWDHWILDFALCNTMGIVVGHLLMAYYGSLEYSWVGTTRGAPRQINVLERVAGQFMPAAWTKFEWHMFSDLRRFMYVLAIVIGTMVVELDAFFLKYILRVQPASPLNVYRLILWWAVGMVGLRDYYAFMTDSKIKRLGATMWTCLAMCLMEFIVVLRFGSEEWASKVPPPTVVYAWTIALTWALGTGVWWFGYELPRQERSGERSIAGQVSSLVSEATVPFGALSPFRPAETGFSSTGTRLADTPSTSSARKPSLVTSPSVSALRRGRALAQLAVDGTAALGGVQGRQGSSPARSARAGSVSAASSRKPSLSITPKR